jgi:GxxExxY protein
MTENEIGTVVVDTSIAIHRELGPGLLETVYEMVLGFELTRRGLKVERQVPIPIRYEELRFDEGFRADLIVGGKVIVELKSVEREVAENKYKPTFGFRDSSSATCSILVKPL